MKKITYTIGFAFTLLTASNAVAQQGFGTNRPDKSAAVDIVSPNKGLLIPRVNLEALNLAGPITNPSNSLLVYNMTKTGGLTEGFYYWSKPDAQTAGKWVPIISALNQSKTTVTQDGHNLSVVDTPTTNADGSVTTDYKVKIIPAANDKQFLATKLVGTELQTVWVSYNDIITENELSSVVNTLKSKVNGVESNGVDIINTNELSVETGTTILKSSVNGKEDTQDLKPAIQSGQIKYEVTAGTGVTIDTAGSTDDLKKFKVNADTGAIELDGDVTGVVNNNKVEKIQNIPVSATVPATGQVLKEVSGVWTPSTLTPGDITEGKKLSSADLDISAVNNAALLEDLTVNIKDDAVTKEKINADVAGAGLGQNADGSLEIKAQNGVRVDTDFLKLGGALTEKTVIETDTANTLSITGLETYTGANKTILVLDANNVLQKSSLSTSNAVVTKAADYTALSDDETILVDAGTAEVTITLPAASVESGKRYYIKKVDNNQNNYVNVKSVSMIDGLSTGSDQLYSSLPQQAWLIQSDGTSWNVVGRN